MDREIKDMFKSLPSPSIALIFYENELREMMENGKITQSQYEEKVGEARAIYLSLRFGTR